MNRHLKKRAHVKRGASSGPPQQRWRDHFASWGVVTLLIAFLRGGVSMHKVPVMALLCIFIYSVPITTQGIETQLELNVANSICGKLYDIESPSFGGFHTGQDYCNYLDTELESLSFGKVIFRYDMTETPTCAGKRRPNACAGQFDHGMGNVVEIHYLLSNGKEIVGSYNHLNNIDSLANQDYFVAKKQVIGYMGRSGQRSLNYWPDIHLHFEMKSSPRVISAVGLAGPWGYSVNNSFPEHPDHYGFRAPNDYLNTQHVLLPFLSRNTAPDRTNYHVFGYANKPLYGSLNVSGEFYHATIVARSRFNRNEAENSNSSANPSRLGEEGTWNGNVLINVDGVSGNTSAYQAGDYLFLASLYDADSRRYGYPILFSVLKENSLIVDNDQPPPLIGPLQREQTEFTVPSKYHSTVPGYFLSAGLIKGQSDKVAKWNPKRRGIFQIVVHIPDGATADSVRYKIVTKKDNGEKKIYVTNPINHNVKGWQPLSVTEDGNKIEHFFLRKDDYVSLHVNVNYVAGDWGGIGENNSNKDITANQSVAIDAIKFKGGLDSDGNDDLDKIHTGLGVTDDVARDVARAVYRNYMTEAPNSIETSQANETISVEHDSNNNLSRYTLNDSVITISWTDGAVEGAASTDDDTDDGDTNTGDNSDDNTSDDPDSDGNDANTDDNTDDNISDETNSDDSDGNDANTDDSTDENVSDDTNTSDNSDGNDADTDDNTDDSVSDDTNTSDSVYDDCRALTIANIQSFLNKFNGQLKDAYLKDRFELDPSGYSLRNSTSNPNAKNPFILSEIQDDKAKNMSPAELIFYSAKENSLNPVLLLAKLQKEQNLITKSFSDEAQQYSLDRATGYKHTNSDPDGDPIYKGFFAQSVAMTFQYDISRGLGYSLRKAYDSYTHAGNPQAQEESFAVFFDIYTKYVATMNEIVPGVCSNISLSGNDNTDDTLPDQDVPPPSITVHTENGNIQISGADLGTNGTITIDGKTVQRPGQGYWTDEGVTLFKETLENLEQPVQIKLVNDKGNEFNICYPFVDVCPDTWYAPPIITLWKKGIVNGYGGDWQGYFRPHNPPVTRAEFVTTTVRAFDPNVQPMSIANSSFSDIQGDDWYAPYVEYAKDMGIISGCETDKFCPNKPISRPAGVKVVVEAFLKGTLTKFKLGQKPEYLFLDVTDPSQWYYPYIYAAQAEKVIKGYPDGSFKLDRDMTRAEMATVICLAFAKVDKETQPSDCAEDMDEITGLPFIAAVTPEMATLNEPTIFTVAGRNLSDGMVFELADCANVVPIAGGTAEKRLFQCTPSNIGLKKGTLQHNLLYVPGNFSVNVQGEVTPKVTSVSPTTATLDQSTTFTVVGSDLPDNLTFDIANCSGLEAINRSPEQQQFQCTPTINGGSQEGAVKDESGAKLKVFFVDVVAPVSETPIELPPKKVFKTHQVTDKNGSTTTVSTFHPSGSINGSVALESGTLDLKGQTLVIYGNLIHSGGTLKVNGGTLIVEGDYRIQKPDGKGGYTYSNGNLYMTNASDKVQVNGSFIMASAGSHASRLAAGTLEVKGDFTQKGTFSSASRENFEATGTHKVVLSGVEEQSIAFETASGGYSHFNVLEVTNTSGVLFTTPINVVNLINGHKLKAPVVVKSMSWKLLGDETITGDLNLEGNTLDLNGNTLTVEGNLIHSGGALIVNGGSLIIEGDYRIQKPDGKGGYTYSNGNLYMTNASDKVQVNGSFIMASAGSHASRLAAGTLEVKGDFTQKGTFSSASRENFEATGTHKVVLSGAEQQTITFETASGGYSHFNMLEIANTSADGIAFNSKIVVTKLFDHHRKPFTLAQTSQFPDYDADTQKDNVDPYPKDPTNTGIVDNSGVLVDVQDAAPNHGDGNGDGILDSEQLNVVSLPNAVDSAYLTLAVNGDGCPIENVEVKGETEYGELDNAYDFPQGLIGFELPCDNANVTVFYHDVDDTNDRAYRKYGPTTPGDVSTTDWYTLSNVSFDTVIIAGQTVATASFTLHDNQLGDDTGKDGIIVDDGGLAIVAAPQNETVGEDEPIVDDAVVEVDRDRITVASCQVYAVNDKGLNNSQFFTISLDDHQVSELGPLYKGHDIEALAIHPTTNLIYAASGNDVANGNLEGHLYLVEGETGELFPVGSTGFREIGDLAFSPDGTLWAWAKGDGMITLDLTTGAGTLVIPSDVLVEGLTLSKEQGRTVFYGSVNTALWVYDMDAETLEVACTNLLGETEALEMMPDGLLLMGIDKDKSFSLHAYDAKACEVVIEADMPTNQFDDVEGIALPVQACAL